MATDVQLVTFGEAMIRFAPVPCKGIELPKLVPLLHLLRLTDRCSEKGSGVFLRTVGGDELNVCVAISRLNQGAGPKPLVRWLCIHSNQCLGCRVFFFWSDVNRCLYVTKFLWLLIVQWISALPTGPFGDVIFNCGEASGVDMTHVVREEGGDAGVFAVIPEIHSVHYQRKHSVFALHNPKLFDWPAVCPETFYCLYAIIEFLFSF